MGGGGVPAGGPSRGVSALGACGASLPLRLPSSRLLGRRRTGARPARHPGTRRADPGPLVPSLGPSGASRRGRTGVRRDGSALRCRPRAGGASGAGGASRRVGRADAAPIRRRGRPLDPVPSLLLRLLPAAASRLERTERGRRIDRVAPCPRPWKGPPALRRGKGRGGDSGRLLSRGVVPRGEVPSLRFVPVLGGSSIDHPGGSGPGRRRIRGGPPVFSCPRGNRRPDGGDRKALRGTRCPVGPFP